MTIGNGDSAKEMLTAGAVSHPAMSGKRWRANSFARSTGGVHVFRTCAIRPFRHWRTP
jgi:hypothetical protein